MNEANHHSVTTPSLPAGIFRPLRALFIVALFAVLLADGLRADVVGNTRPQASPREITVFRGQTIEVPLGVSTESNKQVEFRISTPPAHGKIGEFQYASRDTRNGAIPYSPPAEGEITEDVFFYTARIPDLVVSEAVPVRITILDPVPRIVMEKGLSFGRVVVGGEKADRLQIINEGNADFEAVLAVPKPWFIPQGAARIVVRPTEAVVVPVFFRPTERGAKNFRLVLQPEIATGSVDFFGEGYSPVSASPSSVKLVWDSETKRRTAKVTVTNATDEAFRVSVRGDGRLRLGAGFDVPALGAVEFEPWLPAEDMAEYNGKVTLEAEGFREIIDVRAPVMPAVLEVVEPEDGAVRFAHFAGEKSAVRPVTVRNRGGSRVFIHGEIVAPYRIEEGSESLALDSGNELTFHLSMETARIGQHDRDFAIIGGPDTLRIPVLGTIVEAGTTLPQIYADDPARKGTSETTKPEKSRLGSGEVAPWAMELYLRSVGVEAEKRAVSDAVPQVEQVFLKARTKERLDIWWKHPTLKGEWDYVVETRWMDVDPQKGFPKPVWYPLTGVEFTEDLDGVTAVLDGLKAGQQYILRVVMKDKNGLYGEPTPTFTFGTEVPVRSTWWKWFLGMGVPGGLGAGYWFWRKRQLAEA